ncbi:hypothetical protein GCM10009837_68550 [Streptomyces durmitorensis]|uniref:Uncharacterized protein n=1 Tax=Streptomyces durmitorensis TaxID=319947 RepID=A0ABY4PJG8_9ACTN|nr:hypothetical protein [Streptomyces durmitorensis]UQT53621.1 hypothetical protein M4V62_00170 [Streptomyces durmitorensis]
MPEPLGTRYAGGSGWLAPSTLAWSVLAVLAGTGAVGALLLWPRHDGREATTNSVALAQHAPSKERSTLSKAA